MTWFSERLDSCKVRRAQEASLASDASMTPSCQMLSSQTRKGKNDDV